MLHYDHETTVNYLTDNPSFSWYYLIMFDKILSAIVKAGGQPYRVGGSVRDEIMGIEPKDVDVEVFGILADKLQAILSQFGKVDAVGARFGVLHLVTPDNKYDFSLPRRDSKGRHPDVDIDPNLTIEEAAYRRDFTMNSMSRDINGNLIDPYGGREDIKNRVLRATSPYYKDDPLRVLRGVQFSGRRDLTATPETITMSRQMAHEYPTLVRDTVWIEWYKWATKSIKPSAGLVFLQQSEWINFHPELVNMIGIAQHFEFHPEGDVWEHTKHVVDYAASFNLPDDDKAILMFAALLHDTGKAETTVFDGYWKSPGHAEAGVKHAISFLQSIGAPKKFVDAVPELVREHMVSVNEPSTRSVRRLLSRLEYNSIDLLLALIESDSSGRPPLPVGLPENARIIKELAGSMGNTFTPIIMGRHLIAREYKPGVYFGQVLRDAKEAQINGEFDANTADNWLDRHLENNTYY